MICNCESAHCAHHGGDLEKVTCDPCTNDADGTYVMEYVGEVCEECANVALADAYGAKLITVTR